MKSFNKFITEALLSDTEIRRALANVESHKTNYLYKEKAELRAQLTRTKDPDDRAHVQSMLDDIEEWIEQDNARIEELEYQLSIPGRYAEAEKAAWLKTGKR